MLSFPSISDQPDVNGWQEQRAFDPTIRAKSEGGYTRTRPRTTRIPMQWKVLYAYLSAADKSALQEFEKLVKVGADAFVWTNPVDGTERKVRYREPVKYSPVGSKLYWRAEMVLEEV